MTDTADTGKVPTGYARWAGNILVTAADAVALESDQRLFGNAYVEKTGEGYGRRINPGNLAIRKAPTPPRPKG